MCNIKVPDWNCGKAFATVRVNNWYEFEALIEKDFLDWNEYVFRGQKSSNWPLRSKFDREYRIALKKLDEAEPSKGLSEQDRYLVERNLNLSLDPRNEVLDRLISTFKKACTGRRGQSPKTLSDTEWWALGQHFGLATPLLDWTLSPYVSAYFAFSEADPDESGCRAIWAYSHDGMMEIFINSPEYCHKEINESDTIMVLSGLTDENSRIISQSGLFTRTPNGEDIEEFIENNIDLNGMAPILYKIEIPNTQREAFLRHLTAMNIHSGSLFPDLVGAAEFANRSLECESENLLWKATPAFTKRMLSNGAYHDNNK
ncbi:TPA: FRG domain-containing protein [Vibrio vulnificus]|nr:FRG domain-containing protein [Vibrio vulnificus]HDY7603559.1 FRG domain-containing protein [Vibrio vulnificus]HDY7713303.1 FRG domain-containing protein [Vibrio vulnificus]